MRRRTHRWLAVALFAGILGAPATALADAIGPPPARCPPGAVPSSSHAGEYCRPGTCRGNGDCEQGEVCIEQPLCVEPIQGYSRGGPLTVDHAVTICPEDGACPPGATCVTELRCVSRISAGGGGAPGLPTAGIAIGLAVVLLLLLLLIGAAAVLLVVVRRKKRRPPRE